MNLMMSDYDVTLTDDDTSSDLYVIFHGPKDSPYAGGSWKVHVELPEGYPYKSPSIGFCNRMFRARMRLPLTPRVASSAADAVR